MSRARATISVIIPAYNGESFLAEAVASVRAQSLAPDEIIIVDDGSEDGTEVVIKSLGPDIRSIRQDNGGPAAARNRGLEMASGDLIAFIDADDLWLDGKLKSQARRLRDDATIHLVLGATQRVRQSVNPLADGQGHNLTPTGPVWMLLHLGAGLFRRAVFDTVGGFDEDLRQGEDVDWFMRARELGVEMGISNKVVQLYRRHDANLTSDLEDKDRFFLAALKKSLDRRRAGETAAKNLEPIGELANFKAPRGGG